MSDPRKDTSKLEDEKEKKLREDKEKDKVSQSQFTLFPGETQENIKDAKSKDLDITRGTRIENTTVESRLESKAAILSELEKQVYGLPLDFSKCSVATINEYYSLIEKLYKATYDQLADLNKPPLKELTFENVAQPLINLEIICQKAKSFCTVAKQIHVDKEVRDASTNRSKDLDELAINYSQNLDAFKIFERYAKEFFEKEKPKLKPEQIRFINFQIRDFKRAGLYLEDSKRNELKEIQKKLSDKCTDFQKNVREDKFSLKFTREQLEGLPDTWFKGKEAKDDKFTLTHADYAVVLKNAKNRETRKAMSIGYFSRCEKENLLLLKDILLLRLQLAQLLGFNNHVDYATEICMSKNGQNVKELLDKLNQGIHPIFLNDISILQKFAQEYERNPSFKLEIYDMGYYSQLYKEKEFKFNIKEVEKYFPIKTTVEKVFKVYQDILGLKFEEKLNNPEVWHADVRTFEVYDYKDKQKGELLGKFYLDLHPRPGKYPHVAVFELVRGCDNSSVTHSPGQRDITQCAMVTNFSRENFEFSHFTQFFHEFGHVMHAICSKTLLPTFSGMRVEKDFEETPAKMLERMCDTREILKAVTSSPEAKVLSADQSPATSEPLPDHLVEALVKSRKFLSANSEAWSIMLSSYDNALHSLSEAELKQLDLKKLWQKMTSDRYLEVPRENCDFASVTHFASGYAGVYYSYLYASVFADDMFAEFFEDDPLSPNAGALFRTKILELGGTFDAMELLKGYLQREPDITPHLLKNGLKELPAVAGEGLTPTSARRV